VIEPSAEALLLNAFRRVLEDPSTPHEKRCPDWALVTARQPDRLKVLTKIARSRRMSQQHAN
jgi:hypothetical protein